MIEWWQYVVAGAIGFGLVVVGVIGGFVWGYSRADRRWR